MDDFQKEFDELVSKTRTALRKVDKEYVPRPGLDDGRIHLTKPIWDAYNKRLLELKKKYNRE